MHGAHRRRQTVVLAMGTDPSPASSGSSWSRRVLPIGVGKMVVSPLKPRAKPPWVAPIIAYRGGKTAEGTSSRRIRRTFYCLAGADSRAIQAPAGSDRLTPCPSPLARRETLAKPAKRLSDWSSSLASRHDFSLPIATRDQRRDQSRSRRCGTAIGGNVADSCVTDQPSGKATRRGSPGRSPQTLAGRKTRAAWPMRLHLRCALQAARTALAGGASRKRTLRPANGNLAVFDSAEPASDCSTRPANCWRGGVSFAGQTR